MQDIKFVEKNDQGLDEVRLSDVEGLEAPFFTPELSGPEGLQALLYAMDGLEAESPIMVPGYRWQDIRSKPRFKGSKEAIKELVTQHPFFYYEPVELYRYTYPQSLVTYAFQGDQSLSREFYSKLRAGDVDDAISMLPSFFQPFLEAQMKSLCSDKNISVPDRYQSQSSGKIHEGWRDERADSGFISYFETIVDDAAKSPNAAVIPPVPPVMKSSGKDAISRTRGYNSFMRDLCISEWEDPSSGSVTPYLHFYVDQGVFDQNNNHNDQRVKNAIQKEAENASYAGLALTISGYERIWSKGNEKALERFINEVSSIARANHLPVIMPRSGYYGMHLTDFGVQSFSRLMNGNAVYNRRSGGMDERSQYGTLPIYGAARDVNAEQLETILKNNGGELHKVDGLPESPPTFNPRGSSYKATFGSATEFRIKFGKPRRIVHVKEATELRDGLRRGTANPARRYLERSNHPDLAY